MFPFLNSEFLLGNFKTAALYVPVAWVYHYFMNSVDYKTVDNKKKKQLQVYINKCAINLKPK